MLRIRVNGEPAPQGSKTLGRNGGMFEASKKVGPWREAVRAETQRVIGWHVERGYDGTPVSVRIHFYLRRPAGHYGTGRNASRIKPSAPPFPARTPDLDKLCRALLDGLTAGGAFTDDAQVVQLNAAKFWAADGTPPGAMIEVEAR